MSSLGIVLALHALSDVGLVRAANEDSVYTSPRMAVVADGMGGYEAGEVASAAVVDAFRRLDAVEGELTIDGVRDALEEASAEVARISRGTRRGAGSTVAGAVVIEHDAQAYWLVFNVGDSRVYKHVGSELTQLTVDHSLGQELVDAGRLTPEELPTFAQRNMITRAIGADNSTADSWLMPVVNGERLLVCSDGLTSEVSDEGIRATLTMSGRPESAAEALVRRARQGGGRDNISVIIVDVLSGGADPAADDTTSLALSRAPALDTGTVPVRGRE